MKELIGHFITIFMGFFAIMNPLANTPVFIGLCSNIEKQDRWKVALQSLFIAFIVVSVFSIAGKIIFHFFGIGLPAFRITGGLLVLQIGYHMLQGRKSKMHHPKDRTAADRSNIAVSPLAVPILAGPGTIATAMSFASKGGIPEMASVIVAFAILCLITFVFFIFSEKLVRLIGEHIIGVVTRLMGLILAVIGVQMLMEGIKTGFLT